MMNIISTDVRPDLDIIETDAYAYELLGLPYKLPSLETKNHVSIFEI